MPRLYYEYILKVRPWKKRGGSRSRKTPSAHAVKVVARSQFDAEWEFRSNNPGMTVISCKRGRPVEPPVR